MFRVFRPKDDPIQREEFTPSLFLHYRTGSQPPGWNGWQRQSRHTAIPIPRTGPYLRIACAAYSEQVGEKRHADGVHGETYF